MNGIDYRVRFYPLKGVPFWSYQFFRRLDSAREVAQNAVAADYPMYERERPVLKTEIRAGRTGQCIDFNTVVETYHRTAPICRPDLYKFHGMCGQMLY